MPLGFRWKMGDYVGGQTAVHQAYKPWLAIETEQSDYQYTGEFLIQPQSTADLVVSGIGFEPDLILLASYRPRYHAGQVDSDFGHRGGGMTFGVAGRYQQFTGSTRIRQGFDTDAGVKRWREDVCFNVVSIDRIPLVDVPIDILTLNLASMDASGFTLEVLVNDYDEPDYVAWLALKGNFQVGCLTAADTTVRGFTGTPYGAIFLSTKSLHDEYTASIWDSGTAYTTGNEVEWAGAFWEATANNTGSEPPSANWDQLPALAAPLATSTGWDHMVGIAGQDSQATIWGGCRVTSWNWTTERWEDDASILHCIGASSSFLAGAAVEQRASVSFVNGGIDLSWDVYDGIARRIGYVLVGDPAQAGVIETNWETRPGGSQNTYADGSNFVSTYVRPRAIIMAATNYNFSYSDLDPFNWPRSAGEFWSGGSGGIGWHAYPYSELGYDAYGVHTYGNGVAEIGRYANSSTQYMRRYILAGQGANSNPPAYHQHSINVIASPRQPGLNWRYADRHLTSARLLHDE